MAAPTGLYGHVLANERRSLLLFAMFAIAFQLAMVFGLTLPLILFDPEHMPFYHPAAYARRYVPLLFLLSIALFAAQMWWFLGSVRKRTRFHYVDNEDEPRFCRILEPLAITAGIATPYAGVIETRAMNAFAAGVRKKHMVIVATRGLIDGLDDDELAAVLANAVIHIRNRDTRLLAAATIFMRNMTIMYREKDQLGGRPMAIPSQILALVIFPVFVPMMLIIGFFMQVAFRIAYGSRALIGISREMIADAEAVRLTHNPAALASALQTVEANSGVDEFRKEHAAMLVVGVTQGPLATHPTVEERIGALARTTGSMVLDTGQRLDTRSPELRQAPGFGRRLDPRFERVAVLAEEPKQRGFWGAFRSARDPDRNLLGLDRKGMLVIAAAIVGIGFVYNETLQEPREALRLFDFGGLRAWNGLGRTYAGCVLGFNNTREEWEACDQSAVDAAKLFDHIPGFEGVSAKMKTPKQQAESEFANKVARGCFNEMWDGPARGGHSPNPLSTYLRFGTQGAAMVQSARPGPELDEQLKKYASTRLLMMDNSLHFFGEGGLAEFNQSVDTPEHQAVLSRLAERVRDPKFLDGEFPRQRANMVLLAEHGSELRPCWTMRPVAS